MGGIIDMWKLISINKKKWRHPEAFIVFYEDGKAIARDDKRVKYYNKFTISRLREADQID